MRKRPTIRCNAGPEEAWTPAAPVAARVHASAVSPRPSLLDLYRKRQGTHTPRRLVDPWQDTCLA